MEASPAHMVRPTAEPHLQEPTSPHARPVKWIDSRDSMTILLLLIIAIFIPPLAVLCVTSCDAQFALNVILELLTFGIASFFHAAWVVLYYGKGGRLSWGQRRKLQRKLRAEALEFSADAEPPQARNEAYADVPAYSANDGGHEGDSKYL